MALAIEGLLGFEASVALILGENIGTTITAQLASMGTNINARRTANAHTLFNVIGVLLVILFFPLFLQVVEWLTSSFLGIGPPDLVVGGEKPNIARYIANSHTMFNLVSAVFFLLILPYLVKATIWLTPHKKEEEELDELRHIKYLDTKFIDMPSAAIGQARAEIVRMGEAVQVMYDDVIKSFTERKPKELSKWRKREDDLDNLLREITQFLVHVVQKRISPEESKEITSLMRMANNLERIGDAIENIAQLSEELIEENLYFSEGAVRDHGLISTEVRRFLDVVVEGIRTEDKEIMALAQKLEDNIDRMREEMKSNHIMRLQSAACAVDPGLVFVDTLTAFEKIGDFCYNIAQAVAGLK